MFKTQMKIPCEDCILLARCISKVVSRPYGYGIIKLYYECNIFHSSMLKYTKKDVDEVFLFYEKNRENSEDSM